MKKTKAVHSIELREFGLPEYFGLFVSMAI